MRIARLTVAVAFATATTLAFGFVIRAEQSETRVARLDQALEQYVADQRVAGVVALVLRDGKPVYEKAAGWRDRERSSPMRMDTIFRIASQTKALTSAAILMLVEEGRVGLGDPVSRFIPEFAKSTVAERSAGAVTIVPAKRQIQIKDLLTHTSGMSYGTDAHIAALYEPKGLGPGAGAGCTRRTRVSQSARRSSGWQRCRSSRIRARRTSTATTRMFSGAWSNGRPACRSTSSSRRGSPGRSG
jgi:CubicO group peptidase (beta-lactamase class C family)